MSTHDDVAVAYVRNSSKRPYHVAIATRIPDTHRPVGLQGDGPTFKVSKAICGAVIYMWADGEIDGPQLDPVCRNCARTKNARGLAEIMREHIERPKGEQ